MDPERLWLPCRPGRVVPPGVVTNDDLINPSARCLRSSFLIVRSFALFICSKSSALLRNHGPEIFAMNFKINIIRFTCGLSSMPSSSSSSSSTPFCWISRSLSFSALITLSSRSRHWIKIRRLRSSGKSWSIGELPTPSWKPWTLPAVDLLPSSPSRSASYCVLHQSDSS